MSVKITITGDLGSGKSTVCGELRKKYGLQIFSTGTIQRKIAAEMGMSTFDLNKHSESNPEIDELIDGELIKLSDFQDDIAIDSRMAWHFVNNTFNVFLTTDETIAAQRVMSDLRGPTEEYTDVQHAKELLKARKASENLRYNQKYGVNCCDLSNYDLIVDTTDISPECVADVIMEQYDKRDTNRTDPIFLISPLCLYPTQNIRATSMDTIDKYVSMISDGENINPVDIIFANGFFFIYDGHHRISAYFRSKKALVSCIMLAQNQEKVAGGMSAGQYANREFNLSKAHDWEELNTFRYLTYPSEVV
ncbi:MAG: cytidylate kinase family protein [Oscillospiraceae bacterium]|jgi:cytidylate kinase|nr:cytidylate kinase family protein [Oscillospiraceae bacterium]